MKSYCDLNKMKLYAVFQNIFTVYEVLHFATVSELFSRATTYNREWG